MTNLGKYTFGSIVREMTVGLNEYSKSVHATAKLVTDICSPKMKRKAMAREKPSRKQKTGGKKLLRRELSTLSELERSINVKERMYRKLKKKYKLNKEKIKKVRKQ